MQNFYRAGRRDENEKEIKRLLKELDIPFVVLLPGQGADLLLLLFGQTVFVEIKNPNASKQRQQLTDTENTFRELCNARKVYYVVVSSVEEMQECVDKLWFYMKPL